MRFLPFHDVVAEFPDGKDAGGQRTVGVGGKSHGAGRGHHGRDARFDGVAAGFGQGEQFVAAACLGEVEAGYPAHGLVRVVAGGAQLFGRPCLVRHYKASSRSFAARVP
ncbi:hypothetical protein Sm713_41010 [Streptomyces sp. TS71-3]|nr:hypothetical protein Sm713_41010 [Streptomyces sp. TS71-3]